MDITMTLEELTEGLPTGALTIGDGRGREPVAFEATYSRDLELSDLAKAPAPSQSKPIHTKSLRERHHELAKKLAQGDKTKTQISLETGYSPSRISVLLSDPAFSDLVEHYRGEVKEIFRDTQQRLSDIAKEAADIILERLDENPDQFSVNQLKDLISMAADRTGDGPTSTNKVEGTIHVATPDTIAQIKSKVRERQNGKVQKITQGEILDAEFVEVKEASSSTADNKQDNVSDNTGTGGGEIVTLRSSHISKGSEAEGSKGKREKVRKASREKTEGKD